MWLYLPPCKCNTSCYGAVGLNVFLYLFTGQGVLLDRSVFSDAVFAEVNYQQGTISPGGTNPL